MEKQKSIYFVSRKDTTYITEEDIDMTRAEDIYSRLLKRGTGGVTIQTNAAPAACTSFAKSKMASRASTTEQGYLAELNFPSDEEMNARLTRKQMDGEAYGYKSTYSTAAYHQGFGEKSARALEREETIYQMKGAFPAALLNFTKLRARIEAREGMTEHLDAVFGAIWGLTMEEVAAIPRLVVSGSEATRLAALEDRAYHAMSGHPSHVGGYRVDMATIAPDALGHDVPINWQRLRTTLKAIAMLQVGGDIYMEAAISELRKAAPFKFGMDVIRGSQPRYIRGRPWETLLLSSMTGDSSWDEFIAGEDRCDGAMLARSPLYMHSTQVANDVKPIMQPLTLKIAQTVSEESTKSLSRSITVMLDFSKERAAAEEQSTLMFEELEKSKMSHTFDVPRYKLTRGSLYKGITRDREPDMSLPDIYSVKSKGQMLNLKEFREAGINLPISLNDALRLSVMLTTQRADIRPYAYMLLEYLKVDRKATHQKAAVALRSEALYDDAKVRTLGSYLFSDGFIRTLGHILHSLSVDTSVHDRGIKSAIWDYLAARTKNKTGRCPPGDWKNLIVELRHLPEGWSLYYWARISIGQSHRSLTSGIMAPIVAGEAVDFLTMMKIAIHKRAQHWRDYYSGRQKVISGNIEEARLREKQYEAEHFQRASHEAQDESGNDDPEMLQVINTEKYVPPAMRSKKDLNEMFDENVILNRSRGYKKEQYEEMVKMQTKAKFFSSIEVYTHNDRVVVGMSDSHLLDMLIEFYQARWFSIDRRVAAWKERGKVFKLGGEKITKNIWGELQTKFPSTPEGMLAFMKSLHALGWTISPQVIYEGFVKSISELWQDVSKEISEILLYIEEVEEGRAAIQEDMTELREDLSARKSLIAADPIVLPSHGFVQQFTRPERMLTIVDKHSATGAQISVPMSKPAQEEQSSLEPSEQVLPTTTSDGIELSLELSDCLGDFVPFASLDDVPVLSAAPLTVGVVEDRLLSYREIWAELGMPNVSDDEMRMAYLLPIGTSIDSPHINQDLGPLVQESDVAKSVRAWERKRPFLMKRLGLLDEQPLGDDMQLGSSGRNEE